MKKTSITFALFCLIIACFAQESATDGQRQAMIDKISAASAKMTSLTCIFEQEKSLSILNEKIISEGRMYYSSPDRLLWEYTSPYAYTFLLNNNRILMQAENGKRNVIDVRSSRMFREIVRIMMLGISGNGLTDIKSFTFRYFCSKTLWQVELLPVQKEVKKIFASILLTFNTQDYTVDRVEMTEHNGDKTIISLKNKVFNEPLDNALFTVE
ncbi:MAG: outer membrane lipoprotein carrier protein LolA [Dysgonamonadaceae bacterium]|jgi:outer membrane lipoprotein carrier protein|nr:outer membrane lipoprotein carrier protein LolA [Dysgonamonadaceae bacterium]